MGSDVCIATSVHLHQEHCVSLGTKYISLDLRVLINFHLKLIPIGSPNDVNSLKPQYSRTKNTNPQKVLISPLNFAS